MFIGCLQLILMGVVWIGLTLHTCVFAAHTTATTPDCCCEESERCSDIAASHEPGDLCPSIGAIDGDTDPEGLATRTVFSPQPATGYTLVPFPLSTGLLLFPSPHTLALTGSHPALKFRILLI